MSTTTFANLKSYVTHYLAGSPATVVTDADTTKGRIVNDAGRLMVNCHDWSWLVRPNAAVNYTSGQNFADLPGDFGRLLSVAQSSNVSTSLCPTTAENIARMRQWDDTSGTTGYYALEHQPRAVNTQFQPRPRLALYPTPSSDTASALLVTYRAAWTELVNDADVPNIPDDYDLLLRNFIRAVAYEQDDQREDAVNAVLSSAVFARLAARDGATQANLGDVTGGSLQGYGAGYTDLNYVGVLEV